MSRELMRVPMDYEWDGEEVNPPKGPGYQMWENVSEGSPVSPVFATADELAHWLGEHCSETGNYYEWQAMIEEGYAPSLVMTGGRIMTGVQAALYYKQREIE
jgi:hypothetical protein